MKKIRFKKEKSEGIKKNRLALSVAIFTTVIICVVMYFGGAFEALDYFLFYRHNVIDSSVVSEGNFPVNFTNDDIISADNITSSKMVVLSKNMLTCISYKGRVLFTEHFTFVEPEMMVKGEYGVVFDRGSSKYIVFDAYGVVYEGTTEDNRHIITACVDEKGNCALSVKSNDSACRVYLYDKNGEIKYIWSCAEEYAVSLALEKGGGHILCGTIGSYNNEIYTNIYNLDTTSDDSVAQYKINGSACCNVSYTDKSCAVVDCLDKRVIIELTVQNGSPVEVSYSGEVLLMSFGEEGELAVVTEKMGAPGVSEFTVYDRYNSVVFKEEINSNISEIYCGDKYFYCMTDKEIIRYDKEGVSEKLSESEALCEGFVELKGKIYYYSSGSVLKGS